MKKGRLEDARSLKSLLFFFPSRSSPLFNWEKLWWLFLSLLSFFFFLFFWREIKCRQRLKKKSRRTTRGIVQDSPHLSLPPLPSFLPSSVDFSDRHSIVQSTVAELARSNMLNHSFPFLFPFTLFFFFFFFSPPLFL